MFSMCRSENYYGSCFMVYLYHYFSLVSGAQNPSVGQIRRIFQQILRRQEQRPTALPEASAKISKTSHWSSKINENQTLTGNQLDEGNTDLKLRRIFELLNGIIFDMW